MRIIIYKSTRFWLVLLYLRVLECTDASAPGVIACRGPSRHSSRLGCAQPAALGIEPREDLRLRTDALALTAREPIYSEPH